MLHARRVTSSKAKQLRRGQGLYIEGAMERRRAALRERIESWRSIQALYMPGIAQLCQMSPTRTDAMPSDQDTEKPESMQLWLPSSLPTGLRETGCVNGLVDKERRLRLAEADDALVALRRQLRITTGVFNYKKTPCVWYWTKGQYSGADHVIPAHSQNATHCQSILRGSQSISHS